MYVCVYIYIYIYNVRSITTLVMSCTVLQACAAYRYQRTTLRMIQILHLCLCTTSMIRYYIYFVYLYLHNLQIPENNFATSMIRAYMRILLGWLGTRLAQNTLTYRKIAEMTLISNTT